jgi:hypothetical protein
MVYRGILFNNYVQQVFLMHFLEAIKRGIHRVRSIPSNSQREELKPMKMERK